MSKELFEFLRLLSTIIVILPLIIVGLKFNTLTLIQKKLSLLLVVLLVIEIGSNILWYKQINNLPLYHFYTVLEFWLFLNIYSKLLAKLISGTGIVILGTSFTTFAVLNTLFYQDLFTFNSIPITVLSTIMILIAIAEFHTILKEPEYSNLGRNPMFWISAGVLIYFSGNLILFYLNNALKLSKSESYSIWGLHAIINITLILFYTLAIWIKPEKD